MAIKNVGPTYFTVLVLCFKDQNKSTPKTYFHELFYDFIEMQYLEKTPLWKTVCGLICSHFIFSQKKETSYFAEYLNQELTKE